MTVSTVQMRSLAPAQRRTLHESCIEMHSTNVRAVPVALAVLLAAAVFRTVIVLAVTSKDSSVSVLQVSRRHDMMTMGRELGRLSS